MTTSKSEQSYIVSSLLTEPPLRTDGRSLLDYRPIALETQVADLANGSARVSIGGPSLGGIGVGGGIASTEVIAAVKLEVENIEKRESEGRIVCSVTCSPPAYPHLTNLALDDLQSDYTSILHEALTHPSLQPTNLTIIPHKRAWLLHVDVIVLTNNGNVLDAVLLAATAALRDTRVPRTKAVEFKARGRGNGSGQSNGEDVDMKDVADEKAGRDENSGLDTRGWKNATDFELEDYWDEGEPLKCLGSWPVCITLNFVGTKHLVDATSKEETAISSRLLLFFSIPDAAPKQARLQGMRLLGHGEASNGQIKSSLRDGEKYAHDLKQALDRKLQGEKVKWYPKLKEKSKRR